MIAQGLRDVDDVHIVNVAEAATVLDHFDLVVAGGPTHAWGMSWPSTRRAAAMRVERVASGLKLEPGADKSIGVREWIAALGHVPIPAATFDTRIKSSALFTGRASHKIARRLSRHGLSVVVAPGSFLVDRKSHLLPGEIERARAWGARLATVEGVKASGT